jgi:dipeptidyl aminopeptidase/acylaminoacyl peptidase
MTSLFSRWPLWLLLPGLVSALHAEPPAPRPALESHIDALFETRTFKEVALAPDGRWLAWVENVHARDADKPSLPALFLADLRAAGEAPRRLKTADGKGPVDGHDLAWSPDSRRLAFLSDQGSPEQEQLFVADVEAGTVKKVTGVAGQLARPAFAPGGDEVAFLFTENATRANGPTTPAGPAVGVIGDKVYEQRLNVVNLATSKVRAVSPADHHVYEYDWSPDGKLFIAIAAPGDGNNNWYIAKLMTFTADTGHQQTLLDPKMQIAVPRWSPDGQAIAFIGGLMSDEGVNGGDVYTIPARGGKAQNRTPDLKASASWLAWQPSGGILFTAHEDGRSAVFTTDLDGHTAGRWSGAEVIAGEHGTFSLSVSKDHKTTAVIRHAYDHPPEVWAGPIGAWRQQTQANAGRKPRWGEVRSLHWKSTPVVAGSGDPAAIQGWLLYPQNYDPNKRYPMVVSVHGGPASARRPGWPGPAFDFSFLSAEGYFVFFPNPRGSYGRGEAFTRANVKGFGHGDLHDILAGVDHVLKTVPVDDRRVGVLGWSYGGFMTMWAVTQTNRFKVAVAGAGIANWQSYYGQNGIDQWLIPYFGASVYDDPEVYARSSPINFIKKVKTPTLVLVGEFDDECPAPQSFEFWRALRRLEVPTQLVVYPGEGHGIRRPDHQRDILRRAAAWLHRELRPEPTGEGGTRP